MFKKKYKKSKPSLLNSFYYAFQGIKVNILTERNLAIHFSVMLLVIILGFIFKISVTEWLICVLLFGFVITLELMNTALENVVDLVTEEKKAKAKVAKDAAAGAVLVAVLFAVIIGISIFLPRLLNL